MADTSPAQNDAGAPVIVARGVHKHYGLIHAVDGVDLEVRSGELFGLIGHNGAGKSTMFKMMLGLIPLTAGEIRIDGAPVPGSDFRAVRRKVGYLPENVVLYDNLTGAETLDFFARLKGVSPAQNAALLERVGLMHAAKRRVREYSKGMRQRLGFAQALLGKPRILFLDEPTAGVDVELRRDMWQLVRRLRDSGVTVILTTHYIEEAEEMADRIGVITRGELILVEDKAALMRKLGGKQLTLQLAAPLAAVPPALARYGLVLGKDGQTLMYRYESEREGGERGEAEGEATAIADLLQELAAAGIAFTDLHTTQRSLEDIFVSLVSERAPENATTAAEGAR